MSEREREGLGVRMTVRCVGQGCQMRAPAAEPLGAKSKKAGDAGGGVVGGGRESYERLPPPVKIHQV